MSATLQRNFQNASRGKRRAKAAPPFSLRLTAEERAQLDREAAGQALGAYIRFRLLHGPKDRPSRRNTVDGQLLAMVLATLGQSHLASNMNQLAKAANTGTLDIGEGLAQELEAACHDIRKMRETLISALGLHAEE